MYGNFSRCYATTRVYEGGKVNHPNDPGGKTNKGVTQNTFNAWLRRQGKPIRDVYEITDAETQAIYHDEYWTPATCDELPMGIDMIVFDTAINSGVQRAGILLQATLNPLLPAERKLVVDGAIGSKTLEAVKSFASATLAKIVDDYCNRRLAFMKAIRNKKTGKLLWPSFGKGWSARVGNVRTVAKSMLAGSTVRVQPNTKLATLDTGAKAFDSGKAVESGPSVETAAKATGAAAIGSGVMESVQAAASTFQGLSEVASFFKYAFIALTVGIALYGLYAAIQSSKRAKVLDGEATVPEDEARMLTAEGAASVVPV